MKTLTVREASENLAALLKQAVAGEEIRIVNEGTLVALKPVVEKTLYPQETRREALRNLQNQATLSPSEAEAYLKEVRDERYSQKTREQ